MFVFVLINFGVKNQAPQVSFKNYVVGDSVSFYSHEFNNVMYSDSFDILEDISDYRAQTFDFHSLSLLLPT